MSLDHEPARALGQPSLAPQVEAIISFRSEHSHVKNKNNFLAIYFQMPDHERM
jgi:hypothetical protein